METDLDETQTEYVDAVRRSGATLLSLIDDVLDFSKIEAGKMELEEVDFDPEILAFDVCDTIRPRVMEKPVELLCRIDDELPAIIKGDPARFKQVLTNLAGNAAKFTPSGEIEPGKGSRFHFTAWVSHGDAQAKPNRFIHLSLQDKKALIVDDNAANLAILTHYLNKLHMRVTAVDNGFSVPEILTRAVREGDPFDICISDIQMPEISGYELAAMIRKGAESIKNIPLLALSSVTLRDAKQCEALGFNGFISKPVLRDKLYRMIQRLLRGDHPEVKKTSILESYTRTPDEFDLIFMDIQMPVMDGLTATCEIRKWEQTIGSATGRRIPIVAMTANALSGDREKCIEAGMNDYITKPIQRDVIFQMVTRWVMEPEDAVLLDN